MSHWIVALELMWTKSETARQRNSTSLTWKFTRYSRKELVMKRCFYKFTAHQSVTCTPLHSTPLPWDLFENFQKFFLRATLNGCFCQEKTWKLPCFETYPCSWLKWMIINFFNIFMLKMSAAKFFLLRKQEKYAKFFHYGFSQFNTSSTSWKCLCTHFGHVTKIKTLLNIPLRIIEQNNELYLKSII